MSFSSTSRFFLPLALIIAVAACGLKVGEKAPVDNPITIGGSGFSCLSHITEYAESFVDARLNEAEIRRFMGCIRFSFESFAKHARGLERNTYKPEEIRDFLHEYFLQDKSITNNLLTDFMVIKKTLVGGTVERVTREDLKQAIDFLTFIEEQAIKLNPYMKIYNFSIGRLWAQQDKESEPEVEIAVRTLREVGIAIGERLARANAPYPMEHMESFMREFRQFAGWERIFTNAHATESWTAFLSAYKSVIAGSDGVHIRPKDWPPLLSSAASIYGMSLKARYTREKKSMMYGEGLQGVMLLANDVVRVMQEAVDQQPQKVIRFEQFDRLIDAMQPLGLMPRVPSADISMERAIRPGSFKGALRALLNRIFGDSKTPWRQRQGEGLDRIVIQRAMAEFYRWADVQKFLDRTFAPNDKEGVAGQTVETLSERLGPVGASQNLLKLFGEKSSIASPDDVLGLVRMMEQSLRPLFRPGEDQIFLTESSLLAKYQLVHGFHNLSMMNLSRAVVGLVGLGYSTYRGKVGLFDGGITDEEMQAFYMDFREIGVDMQLFDPRTDNAGYRSYQEANMFTYTGNGLQRLSEVKDPKDAMMSYPEGMEYLLFILSGGAMGRAIYTGMMSEHGLCESVSRNAPISVHGYRMVERNCFRQNLMQILLPRLGTMPTMRAELEKANPQEKVAMSENLMATIFSPEFSDPKFIEWHEITTIAVIMHYTESVMTRYNSDQDTYLNASEVWKAYETFKVYMHQMTVDKCMQYVGSFSNPDSPAARIEQQAMKIYAWSDMKEALKKWIAQRGCNSIPEFVSQAVFAHIVNEGRIPSSIWEVDLMPRQICVVDMSFKDWPLLFDRLPDLRACVGIDFKVDRAALLRVFAALVKASSDTAQKSDLK
ncbi:MAG: hypothetical protein AB7K41_09520 [Bdellovibrionales bacterium]